MGIKGPFPPSPYPHKGPYDSSHPNPLVVARVAATRNTTVTTTAFTSIVAIETAAAAAGTLRLLLVSFIARLKFMFLYMWVHVLTCSKYVLHCSLV